LILKIAAVFDNGVFRPLEPVNLKDGQHIKLVVEVLKNDPLALVQEGTQASAKKN